MELALAQADVSKLADIQRLFAETETHTRPPRPESLIEYARTLSRRLPIELNRRETFLYVIEHQPHRVIALLQFRRSLQHQLLEIVTVALHFLGARFEPQENLIERIATAARAFHHRGRSHRRRMLLLLPQRRKLPNIRLISRSTPQRTSKHPNGKHPRREHQRARQQRGRVRPAAQRNRRTNEHSRTERRGSNGNQLLPGGKAWPQQLLCG